MLAKIVRECYGKEISECGKEELYHALLTLVQKKAGEKEENTGKKKLYYISAEFLIGKLLSNNLINLGIYEEVKKELSDAGKSLTDLEEYEPEPSLGNGGLGRLAACFLDSIATLSLPGDGVGLNYHYGLFRQEFKNRKQMEEPNPWMNKDSWLIRSDKSFTVSFGGFDVKASLYDILVTGYESRTNRLHLFDLDSVDETIVHDGIEFDKEDIRKNLTLFLYPDDSDDKGRLLRVYQQYFMVSCGAQLILSEAKDRGCNLHDLADYAAIQINDTHPSMVIPELIRLLMKEGIPFDEAAEIVTNTCAYTNHTILAEALEKWPMSFIEEVAPAIVPIIQKLNEKINAQYHDEKVAIIDGENRVHMAHMDIHFSHSVNGVAYLHTEILKNTELHNFYTLYPEKFNNKTNGITFRRWLLHANSLLSSFLSETIGEEYKKDAEKLNVLFDYRDDKAVCRKLLEIKDANKKALASYLKQTQGIKLLDNAIYDIQIKRLHEYKRQLMNILHVMYLYNEIKAHPEMDFYPRTFIFGAKAAAGYRRAKLTIKLINSVADVINNDASINGKLKVVFIENYRVSNAELIFAAADVSEQISTASKEASGTGNMKFMLNGAPTLGTMDGANVEIVEEVGAENAFIFGLTADQVINYENNGGYDPMQYFNNDPDIRNVLMQLINGTYSNGDFNMFHEIYDSLLNTNCSDRADTYFILADFKSYAEAQKKVEAAYRDSEGWAKMALLNTASAGKFSSDRTIQQYVDEIWHLDKVTIEE